MTIGVARPAIPFTLGIDTVAGLPAATLLEMRDHPITPIRWIGIYLGEADAAAKRDAAFSVGLPVLLYTFSRAVGWSPSNFSGASDGRQDGAHATELEAPPGVHLITDLEGCAGSAPDTELYLNARSVAQRGEGFGPGLYVGSGQALGGVQLGALVADRYVQALSVLKAPGTPAGDVLEPPQGWNCRQLPRTTVLCGVSVDVNVMQYGWDAAGRMITLWWP